jgi:hypothetical protein
MKLSRIEKHAIKAAQQACRVQHLKVRPITCPFCTTSIYRHLDGFEVCLLCHKWIGTEPKIIPVGDRKGVVNHPCNMIAHEEVVDRFWRKVE